MEYKYLPEDLIIEQNGGVISKLLAMIIRSFKCIYFIGCNVINVCLLSVNICSPNVYIGCP